MDRFNFPPKLDNEKKAIVLELLLGALKTSQQMSNIKIFLSEQVTPLEREFLAEHFLIFEAPKNGRYGQAYITEESGRILLQINARDHFELHMLEPFGELEKAFESLLSIEKHVEKSLPFAFSNKFGYLTSDAIHSGTGLIVNAYVHIPALLHQGGFQQILDPEGKEGLLFTSLQGNPDDLIGDLLVVRNRWTTGLSEESILASIRNTVLRITVEEQSIRSKLDRQKEDKLTDRISRAIGTLQHSFSIDTSEALRSISLVKFGIELGWIQGMSIDQINELFFDCRRAHLAKKLGGELYGSPQLLKARAELFRTTLASIALT
jgi:protein arginine kinase